MDEVISLTVMSKDSETDIDQGELACSLGTELPMCISKELFCGRSITGLAKVTPSTHHTCAIVKRSTWLAHMSIHYCYFVSKVQGMSGCMQALRSCIQSPAADGDQLCLHRYSI